MTDAGEDFDSLDGLAEEFLERFRRGERPPVSQFTARDPGRAEEIRELLSALVLVEDLKPAADQTAGAGAFVGPVAAGAGLELQRLGDYRILREVGRGGMGVVYEAEQVSLGRRVALKVLAPRVSRTSQQARRFLREARSAAQLHHTNIVPVFGVGDEDGLHYYAMQFIHGLGLDKVLDEVKRLRDHPSLNEMRDGSPTRVGPVEPTASTLVHSLVSGRFAPEVPTPPVPEGPPAAPIASLPGLSSMAMASDSDRRYARSVARGGLQVAEALDYAHKQGTLHRDIKPSNLLLDGHGTVWVTDFGLAKVVEEHDDLTRTGDVVGTLRYMAPERFRGRCDARSDVHALGLTIYELLALRPAFDATHRDSLVYQVMHVEPPRLRDLNPAVPRDLETIVHKAIEKEPADRYETAGALAEDLRCFLEDRPIVARRMGSTERLTRWARRNPGLATLGTAVAGMLALIALLMAIADLRLRREHKETVTNLLRAEHAEAELEGKFLESSIDHARASRRSGVAGRRFEALRAIGEAARQDTTGGRRDELRNEAIACMALADLRQARTWPERPGDGHQGIDIDPEGDRHASGHSSGVVRVAGLSPGRGFFDLPGNGRRAGLVRFGPGGRHLAVKHDDPSGTELVVWDLTRRVAVLRVAEGVHAEALDFHPLGRTIAAGRRDGSIVIHDLEGGRELRRLPPGTVPHAIRFDPSGSKIAVVSPNSAEVVQVRDADDGSVLAEWSLPEPAFALDWHPSGRRLAVGAASGRIILLDSEDPSAPPREFEGHTGRIASLAYRPGGRLLASASLDGTLRLWDARTAEELLKAALPDPRPIRFSRDGRFLGPGHDGGSSWVWEVEEGNECRLLVGEGGSGAGTWSVDFLGEGGLLASSGSAGVRLEAPDREAPPAFASMPGTNDAAVAPDGSALITSGTTGLLRWPVTRPSEGEVRVGPPEPLGPLVGVPTGRMRIGRGGRTLAAILDGEQGRVLVFDLKGRAPPVELSGHPSLESIDLSPDGRWAVTGTSGGTRVKVWDARRGSLVRDLPVEGGADVAFSPDGRELVTGSGTDYTFWDVASWTPRLKIPRSQAGGQPGKAAFRRDGRMLAIARTRSLVQLIDPKTGEELATLESPDPQHVSSLGFSPDGRLLVLTFNAAFVQVWDLEAIRRGLGPLGLDWPGPDDRAARPPAPFPTIAVRPAPWARPLERSEKLARAGRWEEAGSAVDEAIEAGAGHLDAWTRRALFRYARGDDAGYREACQHLLRTFDPSQVARNAANNIAWSCALGPGAIEDYSPVISMAESAVASRPEINRLNTLGAVLYRAGRTEEAIRQFDRSIAAHGAGGTTYDALFLAMAHHRLGRREEAGRWLAKAAPAPIAMRKPDVSGNSSWIPLLELDLLRREATAAIEPSGP